MIEAESNTLSKEEEDEEVASKAWPVVSFTEGLERVVKSSKNLSARLDEITSDVRVTLAISTEAREPIQAQRGRLTPENYRLFRPRIDAMQEATTRATTLGLKVIRQGRFGLTVSGPAELIEEICKTKLVVQSLVRRSPERSVRAFAAGFTKPRVSDLFIAPPESLTLPAPISEHIDNIVFIPPPTYFGVSADPPGHQWFGLDGDTMRRLLKVPDAIDGTGVSIAVVDSGFYDHPVYKKHGYQLRPTPTPSSPDPANDADGHGTAIAYNTFIVAPKATVLGIKQSNPPQDALEEAADVGVDIISCSWGYDREEVFPILQATILDLIQEGKILLFASGNGQTAWPASQPEVLAVGGVYAHSDGVLSASNFASGFRSNVFAGRQVPDVCGLCGQLPKGVYLMLPTQPGSRLDRENAGDTLDGTKRNDGWVGASGTSSAAPQVAGAIALLLQQARGAGTVLSPALVKGILTQTCQPITEGMGGNGAPAVGQPNVATGWGLVDVNGALTRIRSGNYGIVA